MATHASRNTTTGLLFEEKVHMENTGKNISKHALYRFLADKGVDWTQYISKKLLPDEAYYDDVNNRVIIYEKKYQQTEGSADEKPQTCAFKIYEFRKLFSAIGITDVSYIYVFNDWFTKPQYKDMLEYIKSVDGCDYIFV
jgi:hypothetical protein